MFDYMRAICTILLLSLFSLAARAQYDPSKVNKKAAKLYQGAMEKADNDDFRGAIDLLENAVKISPGFEGAYLSIAGLYGELKDYRHAIENYEKARSIDSVFFKDYNLPYSINLAGAGEFDKALAAVEDFLSIPNLNDNSLKAAHYREGTYRFALAYAQQKNLGSYTFDPRNLGDSVNTEVSEYYPTLTIDGRQLLFTRRVNNFNEDFYESSLLPDHTWSKAIPLPGNINTNQNEGALNISQDGQWLIFTGCNFPNGMGSCDLYISYLTSEGWSAPENLGYHVNSEFWDSAPSLSPDKQDLYFASNRSGGYGGSDIYVCHRLPNGRWSDPENLGPEINTVGDEGSPFIHADNQTLYFTSTGHPGYGGSDLYLSQKGADGKWGKALNLGYPINTIEDEGSLVVSSDGKTAYYASDRGDSRGQLDIYTFELRRDVRPDRTLWVKGKVLDKKTLKGLPSAVELIDLATGRSVSKVQTDGTGRYLVTLPVGKDYAFNVNRKGYLFYSGNFNLSQKAPDSTYNIDILLQPIEPNATIVLKNIFFDVNKYDLKPESTAELDKVVEFLHDNPALKIQINGHTDNVGTPQDNQALSNNRAKAVVNYLITRGIDPKRLAYKGYGETQPVADNNTPEGRAQNRRTELKILSD